MHTSTFNKYIIISRGFQKHLSDQHIKNVVIDQGQHIKCSSKSKCTERDYPVQDIKCVPLVSVKMSCATTKFPEFPFCGPHVKPHGLQGLRKHYHLRLDTEFGHGKCPIWRIPCACVSFTNIIYNLWSPAVDHFRQPLYQSVVNCTYWTVLGSFNYWNTIKFINKTTFIENFDDLNKSVLDGINPNMASLVHTGKYGATNSTYITTLGYYIVNYLSDTFIMQ